MRDLGTLVWVILIVIGVVSSMISSVRKQAQAQRRPGPAAPPRYPGGVRVSPAPAVPPSPAPAPAPAATQLRPVQAAGSPPPLWPRAEEPAARRKRLFGGKRELVKAVIAAEVLGKPRGLRDEQFPR